jgi:hypothetical protein
MATNNATTTTMNTAGDVDMRLDSVPQYAELNARRDDVNRQIAEVEAELNRMAEIQNRQTAKGLSRADVERAARVARTLGEEVAEELIDLDHANAQAAKLFALREARAELDKRISAERIRASAEICEWVRPAYVKAIQDMCTALIAAHHARQHYDALVSRLNDGKVAWTPSFRPMPPSLLGQPNHQGFVASYLRMAVACGFFDIADVPADLRRPGDCSAPAGGSGIVASISRRLSGKG